MYWCLLLISMLWHRQAKLESKGDKLSSSAECRIRTWKSQDTYSPVDWMPTHKPTKLSRIKLKTWTQQPVPMISEHSAHLTSLPFGFRTCHWRYTYLLLLVILIRTILHPHFSKCMHNKYIGDWVYCIIPWILAMRNSKWVSHKVLSLSNTSLGIKWID